MLVLKSSSSAGRSSVLTARSLSVAAPAPINTPSLRMENNGQDVHVHLVPTGKVGWGTSPRSNSSNVDERELRSDGSIAPFSSSSQAHQRESSGRQVWDASPASSSSHSHEEHSTQRRAVAASSARSFGSSSSVVFGASTGRWGDDAVEQDIARSDMLRARQRERDFPQLKDNFPHSSDQRFSSDSNGNYAHDHHHHQRYDYYETEHRRPVGNDHGDRGYGFERSRASSSYGLHQSNSNQSGYYHPSDARYDNQGHHASQVSAYRQYPDSHERYHDSHRREYHHNDQRMHSWGAGEDDAARSQGRQYQVERRSCNAESNHRGEVVLEMARSVDNQSSEVDCKPVNHESVPQSSEPAAQQLPNDSTLHASASRIQHSNSDTSCIKNGVTTQLAAPTSVWKKVDADFLVRQSPEAQPPMRSSSTVHPSSNFGGRPSSTSVSHRPSNVVTPALAAAPVRILKRDGPRMLFDPKTGTMVNVEERGSSRNQRPVAASSSIASETGPSSSSRESASSVVEPQLRTSASSTTEPQSIENVKSAAIKHIVRAKPEQIKKKSSEKVSVVVKQAESESTSLPVATEPKKPATPNAPVTLASKPLRMKKARDAVLGSKKGVLKTRTKKCVLVYRPVVKQASEAIPVPKEVAPPAPLQMKKFSELFTTSTPSVETVTVESSARATLSAVSKPTKKQTELTFTRTAKATHRKTEKADVKPHAQRLLTKNRKVLRERAKSCTSDASSNHSSHTSVDGQSASSTPSIPAAREETYKLRHSKIKHGVNVDMLKQIPEGGGVVVLTDTQEGIEFVAEDADNRFETVRSRRALLLEKKQLRESVAALPKRTAAPYPRRAAFNSKQGTGSGIVMVAPSRSVKRTLVVGVRANGFKASVVKPVESSEQSEKDTRTDDSLTPVREQKRSSEQTKAQRKETQQITTQPASKTRQNSKLAAKKRMLRESSASKASADIDQEKRVSPSKDPEVVAEHKHIGEERASHASSKPALRKQRDKVEKQRQQVHPLPPATQAKAKKADAPEQKPKLVSSRPARRDSETSTSAIEQQPREAKFQRSSNSIAAPVKKYVPKVPKAVTNGETTKTEAPVSESCHAPERAVISKPAKHDAEAKTNKLRKEKQPAKRSVASSGAPVTTPAPSAVKTKAPKPKSTSHANSNAQTIVAPTPQPIVAVAGVASSAQVHSATEVAIASRKASLSAVSKSRGAKPKPAERPATFKKRLSKSRADLHAPPAVSKSYKQIYVVKGSSASTPVPTSSAA